MTIEREDGCGVTMTNQNGDDEPSLIVIGCGPTGLAALSRAKARGIRAVGVERGPSAAARIATYLDNLELSSPAHHFEVGGLPLDTRQAGVATKDDLLSYYARVTRQHRLELMLETECLEISDSGAKPVLRLRTRGVTHSLKAEHVIMTGWFEWTSPQEFIQRTDDTVPIIERPLRPLDIPGGVCVVLGGGLSAFEYSESLMRSGVSVHVLSRSGFHDKFKLSTSRHLFQVTNSECHSAVNPVFISQGAVHFRIGDQSHISSIRCDSVVPALGQHVGERALALLAESNLIGSKLAGDLRAAETVQEMMRRRHLALPEALALASEERPDLWDQLYLGQGGVRLAGGVTHTAAQDAGTALSILSAEEAVNAIAGDPPKLSRPLPRSLAEVGLRELSRPHDLEWATMATVRVQAVQSPTSGEVSSPVTPPITAEASEASPGSDWSVAIDALFEAAPSSPPLARVAERLGWSGASHHALLLRAFRSCLGGGGLRWLPEQR